MKLIAFILFTSAYSLWSCLRYKIMNHWLARTQGHNYKCMKDNIFDYSTNFKGYNLSDKPGAAGLSPTGKTEQVSILQTSSRRLQPMRHGYRYVYRYRKDTDTRIRHFSKKPDTRIHLPKNINKQIIMHIKQPHSDTTKSS